jgi:manganese-dependent inorganic pyrophosphatase
MSFLNKPLGSTCSLIYEKCIQENINISKEIAILLLAGIISDTLCLQSPTTTDYDREIVIALAKKTNVNYREFATQMFEEGDNSMHLTLEQLIKKDYKEFNIEGERVGISQLFTLSCKRFKQEKESLEKELLKRMNDKNLSLILFVVTDILNNGSYIYFKSTNPSILRQAFSLKNTPVQGFFVENLLSRKKQILPALASSFIKY